MLTATRGHPISLLESNVLLPAGAFPGYTKDTLSRDHDVLRRGHVVGRSRLRRSSIRLRRD